MYIYISQKEKPIIVFGRGLLQLASVDIHNKLYYWKKCVQHPVSTQHVQDLDQVLTWFVQDFYPVMTQLFQDSNLNSSKSSTLKP